MGKPRTILVIDDEQVILDVSKRILSATDFEVLAAADAEIGLEVLHNASPEVVLVDLMLPGMSGLDFLDAARLSHPHVPVIVTTGYSSVDRAVASLKKGAFDFLPKPFTFGELEGPVHRACRFVDLPEEVRNAPFDPAHPDLHRLGRHTWARREPDGYVTLGLTKLFQVTVGPIAHIALPTVEAKLQQGGCLVTVTAQDEWVHAAWAPLSGRVLAVNTALAANPQLANTDPLGKGWMVQIQPSKPDTEFEILDSEG